MKIADLLAPENVLLGLRLAEKRQLLSRLVRHLAPALELDPGAATAALLLREDLGSTDMGDGIALPHARMARDLSGNGAARPPATGPRLRRRRWETGRPPTPTSIAHQDPGRSQRPGVRGPAFPRDRRR